MSIKTELIRHPGSGQEIGPDADGALAYAPDHGAGNSKKRKWLMTGCIKLLLRMLAAPLWGVCALMIAFFSFVLSFAGFFLWLASGVLAISGVILFITHQTAGGIAFFVIAFLISPFGLLALIGWLVGRLDHVRASLKCFVTG